MSAKLPALTVRLLGFCLLSQSFAFAFPLFVLLVARTGHFTDTQSALITAFAAFVAAILQPKAGELLDSPFATRMLGGTMICLLGGIAGLARGEGQPAWLVILSGTLFILGHTFMSTAASKAIEGDVPPDLRHKAASLCFLVGNLGFGIAAVLAYFLIEKYRTPLLILDAVTSLAFAVALAQAFKLRRTPLVVTRLSVENRLTARAGWVALGALGIFIVTSNCFSAIPLLFKQMGLPAERFTVTVFGVNNLFVVILSLFVARGMDRFSPRLQVVLACGLLALGNLMLPFAFTVGSVAFAVILYTAGEVIAYPLVTRLLFSCYPPSETGHAAGIKNLIVRSGMVIAPVTAMVLQQFPPSAFGVAFTVPCFWALLCLVRAEGVGR